MYKRIVMVFLLFLLTSLMVACGSDNSEKASVEASSDATVQQITVSHALGDTTVSKNPETVVVFDYGVLDTLDKLGVDVKAVPQDSLPTYLSKYEGEAYQNAGGIKEPDFEKLSEIDPDLIIISGRQQDAYKDLSELAPTIFLGLDTTRYIESYKENTQIIGEIFGKETEVAGEIAKVEEAIASLNEQATAKNINGLVLLTNDGNINAYGSGSRFGIIHDEFGIKAIDQNIEASTHGQNVSFEYILENDADYLFVVDRNAVVGGESSAQQTLENELIKKTKAYKNNNIIYLNPDYWYLSGGGLISVAEMVNEISDSINK